MRSRTLLAVFLSLALLMTVAISLAPTGEALEVSGPIAIDGDADLASQAAAHNWTGEDRLADGSAERPFNITALSFDMVPGTPGISIRNTGLHLVIGNCEFTGAAGPAVLFTNVSNITLIDSLFDGNELGISAAGSRDLIINDNEFLSSELHAVEVIDCSRLTIGGNHITTPGDGNGVVALRSLSMTIAGNVLDGVGSGIYLIETHNNTINGNEAYLTSFGVYAIGSNNNVVADNYFVGGSYGATIELYSSSNNTVERNYVESTGGCGIVLNQRSLYNLVDDNRVGSATLDGIGVYWLSQFNTVTNNEVYNSELGINVQPADVYEHITDNYVANNSLYDCYNGIYLHFASRSIVANNTIYGSAGAGISAESCSNLTIVDNEIDGYQDFERYQESGIYLYNNYEDYENDADVMPSENNTVARNVITGQIRFGIILELSDRCVVKDNVAENMETELAIYLYRSNYNSILANTIDEVRGGGICIEMSNDNLVESNHVTMAGEYENYGIIISGEAPKKRMGPASEYDPYGSSDNQVVNNIVDGGFYQGITVFSASGNLIDGNTVNGGERAGIYMDYAGQNSVTNNHIMVPEGDGIYLWHTESNTIAGNIVDSLAGYGYSVSIEGGYDDLISGNTITGMDYGVYLYDSFARVYGNTIDVAGEVGISLNNCPGDLQGNVLTDCDIELYFEEGYDSRDFSPYLDILSNNTVNGRPVLFIKDSDMSGQISPAGQGQIILFNVTRYSVSGQDMDHGGVHLFFSDNITVSGNAMVNARVSIGLAFCDNCTVEDNVIAVTFSGQEYQDADGIAADDSSRCVIRHNVITLTAQAGGVERYFDGIYADDVAWFTISGNIITFESAGGGLYATGIIMFEANDCTIAGNQLSGTRFVSEGSGIYLLISNRVGIYGNSIANMTYIGINLFGANYGTVAGNHISDCGYYAISLTASTSYQINGNRLEDNNWRSTSGEHQAYDNGAYNIWNAPGFGNVWSDWNAPDADRDGIVDMPYSISGGSAQDALPVVVTLNVTSPSSFPHYVKVPTAVLGGGARDVYGIASVSWFVVESGASGTCSGTTEWSGTVALTPGENHVRIVMVDAMGLRFVEERLVVYTPGPAIVTAPGPQHYTNQSTVQVDLEVNDIAPITGGNWTHLVDGVEVAHGSFDMDGMPFNYSLARSWELGLGTNVIVIQMNNSAGGETVYRLTAVYDVAAPSVHIDGPDGGELLASRDVRFIWSGSDALSGILGYEVSVDGGAWTAAESGYTTTGLADGLHIMKVRATDRAGNFAEVTVEFTVDATAPTLVITSPANGLLTNNSSVVVEYEADDDQSGIHVIELRVDSGEWTDDWTVLDALADGVHVIEVRATDVAGNFVVREVTVTVDTVAPTVGATSPSGTEVDTGSAVSVTFSEAMNKSSVSIVVNGVTGIVTWDGNVATFAPTSPLAAGASYSVSVSGSDLAGNAVEHSWEFTTSDLGEISGQIVDDDGTPIAGATVRLENGRTTTTDLQGRFTFAGVTPGEHTLTVSKEGYADRTMAVTLAPGQAYGLGSLGVESVAGGSTDGLLIVGAVAVIAVIASLAVFLIRRK